jgi:hypothetical protein
VSLTSERGRSAASACSWRRARRGRRVSGVTGLLTKISTGASCARAARIGLTSAYQLTGGLVADDGRAVGVDPAVLAVAVAWRPSSSTAECRCACPGTAAGKGATPCAARLRATSGLATGTGRSAPP